MAVLAFHDRFIAPAVDSFRDDIERDLLVSFAAGARILDVGCGGGQLCLRLATTRPDPAITGLDLAPEQTERARRRGEAAGLADRVTFVTGSALELPWPAASFEGVVSVASMPGTTETHTLTSDATWPYINAS